MKAPRSVDSIVAVTEGAVQHRARFRFCLYVAGHAQNSAQAAANLAALCRTHLAGRHEIELVDVFREPARARADGISLTPTLVKVAPLPERKIVGSLSRAEPVLLALGLPHKPRP